MQKEPTRIRQGGTEITDSRDCPELKIEAIRRILGRRQYAKIDGFLVDGFSAAAIIALYDKLNDKNKKKYLALPLPRMASIAFKIINQFSKEKTL